MKYRLLWLLLAAAALPVCGANAQRAGHTAAPPLPTEAAEREERTLLNSERIERKFGSYGIAVLHSDGRLRISNLYSATNAERVTRTFAVVAYPDQIHPDAASEHREITDGGSIGAVFAAAGWTIAKINRYYGEIEAAPKVASMMRTDPGRRLAVHVYVLSVAKGETAFDYCAIAEIHHPDYLGVADLEAIYGPVDASGNDPLVERILDAAARHMR